MNKDLNDGLPENLCRYLEQLTDPQGPDKSVTDKIYEINATLGEDLRKEILETCREVTDSLSESFKDFSSTGFELDDTNTDDSNVDENNVDGQDIKGES